MVTLIYVSYGTSSQITAYLGGFQMISKTLHSTMHFFRIIFKNKPLKTSRRKNEILIMWKSHLCLTIFAGFVRFILFLYILRLLRDFQVAKYYSIRWTRAICLHSILGNLLKRKSFFYIINFILSLYFCALNKKAE